jgi:small-conductance mechanosensitive channel
MGRRRDALWRWIVTAALIGGALLPTPWWPLPRLGAHLARAALAVGAGYFLTAALEQRLASARWSRDLRRAGLVRLLVRLLVFLLVAAAALGALGVKYTQITFGGAMLTVILGLAGQTLFANVIAGVVLVIWRPFEIGDDISVVSWQMPLLASTHPHETLPSANPVTVRDVNLLHTICVAEDGAVTMIPNSVLLQAIVRNRTHSGAERLRVVAEAEHDLDAVELWARLQDLGRRLAGAGLPVQGPPVVQLLDLTASGTSFVVETWVLPSASMDEVRSAILVAVAGMLREMRAARQESLPRPG